jgi:hypothetical protein
MRRAQDETARNAYNLQTASQYDPLRVNQLQLQNQGLNRQNQIEQNLFDEGTMKRVAEARAAAEQLHPGMILANYGITGPLRQEIPGALPGSTNMPAMNGNPEGVGTTLPGPNGSQVPYLDPGYNIMAPQQMHSQYQQMIAEERMRHNAQLEEQARENAELRRQLATGRTAGAPINTTTFLNGINTGTAPGAVNTTPSTGSSLPYQNVDSQKQYRQQLGTPRNSGDLYGF